jgi:hypothetical protein
MIREAMAPARVNAVTRMTTPATTVPMNPYRSGPGPEAGRAASRIAHSAPGVR